MTANKFDLIVIGAGPGGYVAAIRAAQLGLNVACIDKNRQLGGTCLRIGCIPSKALLESSELYAEAIGSFTEHGIQTGGVQLDLAALLQRKDRIVNTLTAGISALFKKHRVTPIGGRARLVSAGHVSVESDGQSVRLEAKHILIATGSRPAMLPGIEVDGERVGTSTEALSYPEVPGHLVVIGAGYIGLELGTVWRRLGARVSVLETLDRILPGTDAEIASAAQKVFEKQGLQFRLSTRVSGIKSQKRGCLIDCEGAEPIECDRVLVAVGRQPNTEGLGLDTLHIATDSRGRITVNERFETSVPGVFAIGDVIPGPMLAHKAEDEGIACVEQLTGRIGRVNYDAIPSVVYTHPEIAAVGKSEEQLQAAGIEFRKGVFPFRANGRARTLGETEGFVKVLVDQRTDRVLGVHILGPRAGDLIAEGVAAIEFGATSEDIFRCSHAHPTLSEAFREAALAVHGQALHI